MTGSGTDGRAPIIHAERFAELGDDFGAEGAREMLDALETLARTDDVSGEALDAVEAAWAATRSELRDPESAR